jgi:beta-glucosidase
MQVHILFYRLPTIFLIMISLKRKLLKSVLFGCGLLATVSCTSSFHKQNFIALSSPEIEHKIDSIISVLTLEEKINMLCGNGLFSSPGIERLGIRDLQYTDGPFGIREELGKRSWTPLGLTTDSATFFPTGSALAATWNPDLAYTYGTGIGEEAISRGKNVHLGPAINITRTPLNGRTFEYMSEDPFLNSRLAVAYIRGVQSTGTASCVKHLAVNNQESFRDSIDVQVDERALREIYLPAFKACVVEAGAYSVMSAYNRFRSQYCGENDYLLNKILKKEWHFNGMVISDWGGTHSTVKAALNGLDMEMGTNRYFTPNMLDSVKSGLIPESVINDKVRRILRVYYFCGQKSVPDSNAIITTPAHRKIVYEVASQSIVLLKNKRNILPLNALKLRNIVVIGENALQKYSQGGFGAGVKAKYEVTPLDGLKNRLGNSVKIDYKAGYKSQFIAGSTFIPDNTPDFKLIYEAAQAAVKADAVVLVVGNNREVETESADRTTLKLPFAQDELIKAVCKANPRTIVVVIAGAPVDLSVADSSSNTLLFSWFNGSEAGNALADVLLGTVNPSGKLPFTIPVRLNDSPAHALGTFPGKDKAVYSESILVGYRWFDKKNISPEYPFGHGLSYSNFEYKSMTTNKDSYKEKDTIKITLAIANNGIRDGMETAQIYTGEVNPVVLKAVKELKGFKKILVPAGKEVAVTINIPVSSLAWFNEKQMDWNVSKGIYQISAGSSSRDLRKVLTVHIK